MPKPRGVKLVRLNRYREQGGRCFYCGRPMWELSVEDWPTFGKRTGVFGASKDERRRMRCTAEHVTRRADGGGNGAGNIVAACLECNSNRGECHHEEYRERVAPPRQASGHAA